MTAKPRQRTFVRGSSDKINKKRVMKALRDTLIAAFVVPLALVVLAGALAFLLAYLW